MGSVGFLLADWSIEIIRDEYKELAKLFLDILHFRSKKRKAKAESNKLKKNQKECSVQTEGNN